MPVTPLTPCRRATLAALLAVAATAAAAGDEAPASHGIPATERAQRARADAPDADVPPPAAPALAANLARPYAGNPQDVLTYHYDNLRTGWNPAETELTVASVKSARFGLLKTLAVDGEVLAQPLLVSGFRLPDGSTHDVLVVATEHDSVYAFDARSYAPLWQVSLGAPQTTRDVGCSHVSPEYGVSATPVILRPAANRAAIYVVAETADADGTAHSTLHALNLADGRDLKAPVELSGSTTLSDGSTLSFQPARQWIRAGLAYANGAIVVAASSHCDASAGAISGWLLRYDPTLKLQQAFATIHTPAGYQLAAFWNSGFAPAIDGTGNVYAITGNGAYDSAGGNWGESVLKLPPALDKVADWFTPAAYASMNSRDLDFGAGGVMLLPERPGDKAPPLAVAMGKDDVLYLLDRDNLGHSQAADAGALQVTRIGKSGSGVWGGPAFYAGAAGEFVYYQTSSDVLRAFRLDTSGTPSLVQTAQGTSPAGFGGSLPIVTANRASAGTGVVWLVRRRNPVQLEAYDAEALGAPIFTASAGPWPRGNPFLTAMAANGRVYVGASGTVSVFGLAD